MQGSVTVNSLGMEYGTCWFLEVDLNSSHTASYFLQKFLKRQIIIGYLVEITFAFFFMFLESQTCCCPVQQTGI